MPVAVEPSGKVTVIGEGSKVGCAALMASQQSIRRAVSVWAPRRIIRAARIMGHTVRTQSDVCMVHSGNERKSIRSGNFAQGLTQLKIRL